MLCLMPAVTLLAAQSILAAETNVPGNAKSERLHKEIIKLENPITPAYLKEHLAKSSRRCG